MSAPEFSRMIDRRHITTRPIELAPDETQRAALARRFGLVSIDELRAQVLLEEDGDAVAARGRLQARVVQSCAISGEDLPVTIDEPIDLRFVPEKTIEAEELELEETDLDEISFTGDSFDLGEAVAQTLALAIDPYAVGPDAERVRQETGLSDQSASGPFAALAALKKS